MTRRLLPIVLIAATLAAGCTTFSDNDAAARVGEDELSDEMLEELVGLVPDPQTGTVGEPTDGNAVRNALTFWVQAKALDSMIVGNGVEVSDDTVDNATQQASAQVTGFTELSSGSQDFLVGYFASSAVTDQLPGLDDAEKAEYYDQGMEESGIACVSQILVETREEALDVIAELDAGGDFPTIAQERSIDTGSGALGGVLPCTFITSFETQYVPPFVEASRTAVIGVATDPVESDFGFHVIRVRTFDEVSDELGGYFDSPDFAVATALDSLDIYVNPRYGTLDDRGIVVPLG